MTAGSASSPTLYRVFDTPDGEFYIAVNRTTLVETGWTALRTKPLPKEWKRDNKLAPDLVARVKRAVKGEMIDFSDVALPKSSDFFAKCRRAIQRVRAGRTVSYGELAKAAGNPRAARAAGQAMRRNPTPIIVPCHRVVASTGALGGFGGAWAKPGAGSVETDLKAALLQREKKRKG